MSTQQPGSKVRIAAPQHMIPQTLVGFLGRVGVLIQWEDEISVCRFGNQVILVAAGHLEGVQ